MSHGRLYHYTKLSACEEILQTKVLRFTSCKDYKDSKAEGCALREVIKRNLSDKDFKDSLCNFMEKSTGKGNIKNGDLIDHIFKMRYHSYIVCFSVSKDNADLWEKYAEDGRGVVIEFDKKYIVQDTAEVTSSTNGRRDAEIRFIKEMSYGEEKFVNAIKGWGKCGNATLVFDIDAYKDAQYSKELECRLCAYIPDNTYVYPLENEGKKIIRHFKKNKEDLELALASKISFLDNTFAISKIYCKDQRTYNEMAKIINASLLEGEIKLQMLT